MSSRSSETNTPKFRVVGRPIDDDLRTQSFSLELPHPQEFDLAATAVGPGEYRISQKLHPAQARLHQTLFRDNTPANRVRWTGISRCGRFGVGLYDSGLLVRSVDAIAADDDLLWKPLSLEEIETFFVQMLHDSSELLTEFSFTVSENCDCFQTVTIRKPRKLLADDSVLSKDLLDRLYFQFTITRYSGDKSAQISFDVPISKTYGSVTLMVSSLHACVSTLQYAWDDGMPDMFLT